MPTAQQCGSPGRKRALKKLWTRHRGNWIHWLFRHTLGTCTHAQFFVRSALQIFTIQVRTLACCRISAGIESATGGPAKRGVQSATRCTSLTKIAAVSPGPAQRTVPVLCLRHVLAIVALVLYYATSPSNAPECTTSESRSLKSIIEPQRLPLRCPQTTHTVNQRGAASELHSVAETQRPDHLRVQS